MKPMNKTLIATATTAAVGALATRSGSRWYRRLSKPSWQPPAQVFPRRPHRGPAARALRGVDGVRHRAERLHRP
jgi:hypothetical protein